jgi:hypothetical protein
MQNSLIIILLLLTIVLVDSSCTLSDILSNNIGCLPSATNGGTFIEVPTFKLQLQLSGEVNENDNVSEGIRYALEYYLNYTLSQFDDDTGFDNGGFGYSVVEDVQLIETSVPAAATTWKVTAKVYYNSSLGGWVFSSVPTDSEVLQRIQSVIEEPIDDGQEGHKFEKVLEMLLYEDSGMDEFLGVGVGSVEANIETAGPTNLITTLEPTVRITYEPTRFPITLAPSENPTKLTTETESPTKNPITVSPSARPTPMPSVMTDQPTDPPVKIETSSPSDATFMPTPWPTFRFEDNNAKTMPPTVVEATDMIFSSPPTGMSDNGSNEVPGTASLPTVIHDSDSPTIQNGGNMTNSSGIEQQDGVNKAMLDPSASRDNQSTIIASATLAGSFLVLIVVSGAYFVSRHGHRRKNAQKNAKDHPLHTLSDGEWNSDLRDLESLESANAVGVVETASSKEHINDEIQQNKEILNETADSLTKFDDMVNRRQHSPMSPTVPSKSNDRSALSTSTDKSNENNLPYLIYDEDKMAKKEMARELFLSNETLGLDVFGADFGTSNDDTNAYDVTGKSPSLGVCRDKDVDVESSRSLEYSESDAPSCALSTAANLISPASLPNRRNSLDPPERYHDPPENHVTVVTDDESTIEDVSYYSPELSTKNSWKRCLADCAPTTIKDLVSPMRHQDECDEVNEIAIDDDKWLNDALCGRDWDFNDTLDERSDSPQEFTVLR